MLIQQLYQKLIIGMLCLIHKMVIKKIKIKKMKIIGLFIVTALIISMSGVLVSAAFGIGFSKSINLYPGQSLDKFFSIQNTMEPVEDLVVKVSIVEGAKYVSLPEGDEFNVLAGKTVPVKARISIPETARVGSIYNAEVLFKTLSASREGDEGMVSFTTGHSKSFKIEVIPKPGEERPEGISTTWIILGIVLVIVIIVIIWFVNKNKKASK